MLIHNNKALKQKLAENDYELVLTLSNGTLTNQSISNSKILQDSFSVNRFSVTGGTIEVGSATSAEMQVTIDNSDGSFDDWTFEGATIFARLKATISGTAEYMDIGYFIVDEVVRQRDSIQLVCLDKMVWFDKAVVWSAEPNDGGLEFSTSPATLLNNICSACNVSYNSASFTANAVNQFVTLAAPTSENITYRQLLQWLCQVIGVCAYINESGALAVAWYAQKTYSGEDAEDRAAQDIITPSNRFSSTIDRDPITISNISVKVGETTYAANSNNTYTLAIEGNELISDDNYASILSSLATRLVGFSYYPFTADVLGLQWLQPLDITTFVDKGDVEHTVIVTDWTYSRGRNTQLAGKGESATRKGYASNPPFTAAQQRIIEEIKKNTPEVDIDDRIEAVFALNNAVNNGMMLHSTTIDGKVYYHNAATLANSNLIATANTGGFAWTTSGWNSGNPSWSYGISSDGAAVLQTLSTYSLNADLITAGRIDASQIDVVKLDASNITTGTLQDAAQKNTINFANGSFSLGNGNIVYDAVNNTFSINSSVVIGAAQQAVADALSNQVVEYAISESGSIAPVEDGLESLSEKWFYASSTTMQNSDIVSAFDSENSWSSSSQYYSGLSYIVISTGWKATNKYLYSFMRTENASGTWTISNAQQEAVFGTSSSSDLLESITCWMHYAQEKTNQEIQAAFSQTSVSFYTFATRIDSTYPYLYSAKRNTYRDGTVTVTDVRGYGLGGSDSVIIDSQDFWVADAVSDVDNARASYLVENWLNTSIVSRMPYTAYGFFKSLRWSASKPYMKLLTRTLYANGSCLITNMKLVAIYGETYPQFGVLINPWSTTMPSIADNKGKYLWTRTTIGSAEPTYEVNYIGNDGAAGQNGTNGTDGVGITGQEIKYAISTSGTTAPSSGWQSNPPSTSSDGGKYLWTRTVLSYSNNTSSTSYSVAYIAENGSPGKGISTITQYYYATEHDNDTLPQKGTNSWKQLPSDTSFSQGVPYLWSYTETTYTVGNATTTTPDIVGYWGQDGSSGSAVQGRGIVSIVPQYVLSTSNSTSNRPDDNAGWSDDMPPYSDGSGGVRRYYWQRDKITYDKALNGNTISYTTPVLLQGVNSTMLAVNELNADFARVIVKENNQTYIDGAKIYTGSVTASDISAYNALIKNLMANDVQVDGDIEIYSDSLRVEALTDAEKNSAAQTLYEKSYSSLDFYEKMIAFTYASSIKFTQAFLDQSKLIVKSTSQGDGSFAAVLPQGLFVSDTNNSEEGSLYSKNARVAGTLEGLERGVIDVRIDDSSYSGEIPVDLKKEYDEPPVIMLTPYSTYSRFGYALEVGLASNPTTTQFTVGYYTTNHLGRDERIAWVAIP